MTRRSAFVFSLSLLAGLSACASLIGDFDKGEEVADSGGGDAAGADASNADGMSNADASTDGSNIEGGGGGNDAEAGPTLPTLVCHQDMSLGNTVTLATFVRNASDFPDTVFFLGALQNNGLAYVIVQGSPGGGGGGNNQGGDLYRYLSGQNSPSVNDIPVPSGQIYDAHRTADGVVVLSLDNNLAGHTQLVVYKLSEAVKDAGLPVWTRIPIGGLDPVPNGNNCRAIGSFAVIDSTRDDYVAAISYNPTPDNCATLGAPLLYVTRTGPTPDGGAPPVDAGTSSWVEFPVPQIDGGTLALGFGRDAFVIDPNTHKIHLLADPSGGGPSPGVGPLVFSTLDTVPEGGSTARQLGLGTGIDFAGQLAAEYGPITGRANAAFLGGDIALASPALYVGNVPTATFSTTPISPAAYKPYVLGGIDALPVDKGRAHWNNFGGTFPSENVLMVGRNSFTGGNGVNFFWFDNNGNLRSQQAGSDAGTRSALLQTHNVVGVDVTFDGPPTSGFAGLFFAITEQVATDGGQSTYSLLQIHSQCLTQ